MLPKEDRRPKSLRTKGYPLYIPYAARLLSYQQSTLFKSTDHRGKTRGTRTDKPMLNWIVLYVAIAIEICGTMTLKLSHGAERVGLFALAMILYGGSQLEHLSGPTGAGTSAACEQPGGLEPGNPTAR